MASRAHTTLEHEISVQPIAIALQRHPRIFLGFGEEASRLFVEQVGAYSELTGLREEHVPIRRNVLPDARRRPGDLDDFAKVGTPRLGCV